MLRTIGLAALLSASATVAAEPYAFAASLSTNTRVDIGQVVLAGSSSGNLYLGAGYRFSRHFALEGSYLDLAEIHGTGPTTQQGARRFTTSHFWKAKGPGLAAVGAIPISDAFAIEARIGAHRLSSTLRSQTVETDSTAPAGAFGAVAGPGFVAVESHQTVSRSFWAQSIGLAAHYAITQDLRLGAMFQQMRGAQLERLRMRSLVVSYAF